MRISDWSSDVCSSDLSVLLLVPAALSRHGAGAKPRVARAGSPLPRGARRLAARIFLHPTGASMAPRAVVAPSFSRGHHHACTFFRETAVSHRRMPRPHRSEEHTSELQSLMRNSYSVFCLKKKILT